MCNELSDCACDAGSARPIIIEQSESRAGHQMMTVQTSRGKEYVVDAEASVCALAELFSNYDNEQRLGRQINAGWFAEQIAKIRSAALQQV